MIESCDWFASVIENIHPFTCVFLRCYCSHHNTATCAFSHQCLLILRCKLLLYISLNIDLSSNSHMTSCRKCSWTSQEWTQCVKGGFCLTAEGQKVNIHGLLNRGVWMEVLHARRQKQEVTAGLIVTGIKVNGAEKERERKMASSSLEQLYLSREEGEVSAEMLRVHLSCHLYSNCPLFCHLDYTRQGHANEELKIGCLKVKSRKHQSLARYVVQFP